MKKLMIAVAIVCVTVMANAATWNWTQSGTSGSRTLWDNGTASKLYATTPSATIYLFDAGTIGQDALLTAIRGGATLDAQTSVKTTTLDSDSHFVDVSAFSYGEAKGYNFYMAVMDKAGNIFLSDSVAVAGQASATQDIAFSGLKTPSQTSFTSDATKTFAVGGAGWYSVAPEPTSGLLLLLGMGALALRRRRA